MSENPRRRVRMMVVSVDNIGLHLYVAAADFIAVSSQHKHNCLSPGLTAISLNLG